MVSSSERYGEMVSSNLYIVCILQRRIWWQNNKKAKDNRLFKKIQPKLLNKIYALWAIVEMWEY